MSWQSTGRVAPRSLGSARLQLHYGAYVLGSTAHSLLPHRPDDSHSNLGYDDDHGSLRTHDLGGGVELHLDIEPFQFELRSGSAAIDPIPLAGQSIDELLLSITSALPAAGIQAAPGDLSPRQYPDFPASPLMTGGAFEKPPANELRELRHWFANAAELMAAQRQDEGRLGEARVWPHHFDLGALVMLSDAGDRSIGVGLSPGDDHFDQPYFYCSPYPQPEDSVVLPRLKIGEWTRSRFVSAILTGEALHRRDGQERAAREYLTDALAHCRQIVAGSDGDRDVVEHDGGHR